MSQMQQPEENLQPIQIYQDILGNSFEKIKKNLPKKYLGVKDLVQKMQNHVMQDPAHKLDANRYFIIYKLAINTKQQKLIEVSLKAIQQLISYNFLNGNCPDYTLEVNLEEFKDLHDPSPLRDQLNTRKLISTIMDTMITLANEKEENNQMLIIKIFVLLATHIHTEMHDIHISAAIQTIIIYYSQTRNGQVEKLAKQALQQIINYNFQKLSLIEGEKIKKQLFGNGFFIGNAQQLQQQKERGRATQDQSVLQKERSPSPNQTNMTKQLISIRGDTTLMQQNQLNQKELSPINNILKSQEDAQEADMSGYFDAVSSFTKNQNFIFQGIKKNNDKNQPTFDTICLDTLINIVDDVCIYQARKDGVVEKINQDENIPTDQKQKYIDIELQNIPTRVVPTQLDPNDPQYFRVLPIDSEQLVNENDQPVGLFGWCSKCRNTANYYCKDLRVPVCSIECKISYQQMNEAVNKRFYDYQKNSKIAFEDCLSILQSLSFLLIAPPEQVLGFTTSSSSLENAKSSVRLKVITLEMIYAIFDLRDSTFFRKELAIKVIKEKLFDGILKCCLNNEKSIFSLSFGIFLQLLIYHKEEFKNEISIFINEIFLQLLESPNSSSNHRHLALQVLNKAFQKTRVVLDFYVNYDCSFNQVQLVDRIVSILSKIATGLYSRPEFQMMIQPNQELLLRQYAVETLALMMRSIYEYFDNYAQQQDSQNQNLINGQSKNDILNGGKNLDDTTIMQQEENREIIKIDLNDHQNQIEKEHIIKIETQRAIQKFNKKPSLGIKHLIQTGIIQPDDAVGIAKFLRENPSVSKDQIGEYIGGHHELNINVLSEFTDLINFQDRRIDVAMRQYLETFTLPGEAQIVDRILQKFGDKFQRDNPQTFQSAGGAYTLSFLLIMLQTDMYNPQVKDKMKLEDFIKIAKNIEGEHFETDYLTELYRSIQKEPLALHEKAKTVKNLQDSISTTMRKKQDLFLQETQKMIEKGKNLISEKNKLSSKFIKANSMYYIGPLVETIGPKILSAFKHALENCDDDKTVRFSLEGFNSTILLSCHFNLEQERNSFIEALCLQSNLESFPNNFKKKNYSVIKQVLHLSQKIGNSLHQSWLPILALISKLNENRLIQNGVDKRQSGRRPSSLVLTDSEWSLQQSYVESDYIDRIYAKSTQLDGESILDFINSLCQVSKDELTSKSQTPRIFSLQKIVEIAELNMDRVVIVWNRIWAIIRDHFAEAGCHQNPQIAIIAVDSLKQLSQKFFIKEERFNQQFQRDFLKPFEIIFSNVPIQNLFIKDFILDCFKNFLGNKTIYKKIKSGWRIIFNILGLALLEESDELSRNAYNIVKGIMEENLDTIHDVFVDLVQCLNKLSKKRQEDLALASIELVQKCLYYLADKSHVVPKSKLSFSSIQSSSSDPNIAQQVGEYSNTNQTNKKSNESYWVPLLGVLSNLCGDHRPEIQEKSMESLFNILTEFGYTFSIEFWKMIFQGVLRPLFDEIQFTFQTKSLKKFNWLKQSCNKAFHHITNLLFDYYDELQSLVIEFIKTYENCINNTNEQLIKQSVTAAKNTIIQLGPKFKSDDWDMIIGFFERMIRLTTPQKLLSINSDENGHKIAQDVKGKRKESLMYFYNQKINFDDANAQSKAQLLLIKVIQDVINSFQDKLSSNQLDNLCNILDKSYLFAIEFNSQIFLRYCLWKTGFNPELKQLPGILRQERQAQAMSLYIKYTHYRKQQKSGSCFNYNDLIDKLVEYMTLFLKKHKDLLKIIESERDKRSTDEKSYYDSYERLDVPDLNEETIDLVVHKIKLTEVERDVNNHRTMISETVLPILEKIDLSHMKERVKEIYCILIDMTQYSLNRSFSQMVCQLCKNCSRCQNLDEDLDMFIRKILKKLFKFICDNPLPAQAPVAQVVLEQSSLLNSVNQIANNNVNQQNDKNKETNLQTSNQSQQINSDYVKITNSSSSIPEATNEINGEVEEEAQNENGSQKVNVIKKEHQNQDDSDNQLKIEKNLIKQVAGDYDEDDLNGSGNKNVNQNNIVNINSNGNSKSNSENNIDQNQQNQ